MITIDEQIQEVKREIAMRYTVYGRRVESGKMTQAAAARLIEIMQAVLDTLTDKREMDDAVKYVGKIRE